MQKFNSKSTIIINGNSYTGNNISVVNGKVFINGKDVTPDSKEINITVQGNIEKIEADSCNKITVTGDVNTIKTTSGDIDITGNISGSVSTISGDVKCGNINGSVSTISGDIKNKL